ncbi:amidohydrolase [Cohaesibacter sp. ES.047]|uniref:amidohydrolase n=1 Tax=Cohaesibacter sp. ES.047 TaxID=1798205 RepID=UPI000BB6F13E|nr:amidohydrolase [Cohaesibacter sp. ES.047]SNY92456.1 amidohydrolase [Cohaesibacter sp. ES.047]
MTTLLTDTQLEQLVDFRHLLHRHPELSGEEAGTAQRMIDAFEVLRPDKIVTRLGAWQEPDGSTLGGTGVAAVYDSGTPGPTLLFRCELDGLPIDEISQLPYRSRHHKQAHLCGHDGHMAIMRGLAMRLSDQRPAKGRVVLMFQPAEETGKGAKAVLADPNFAPLIPDHAFALHNLPGVALGEVVLKSGAICCASRGVKITFDGKTSHASMPQDGLSPVDAILKVVEGLEALSNGINPDQKLDDHFKLVTITHLTMGEPCYGVAPSHGEIWATLRTVTDEAMEDLFRNAHDLTINEARRYGLSVTFTEDDGFEASVNSEETTQIVREALQAEGIPIHEATEPERFSEDFGRFSSHCPSTLFFIGSGETQPQLHNPDFDFPDELIGIGCGIYERIIKQQLG